MLCPCWESESASDIALVVEGCDCGGGVVDSCCGFFATSADHDRSTDRGGAPLLGQAVLNVTRLMAAKGKSEYAEGTDGSDHTFRQRVDPVYQKTIQAKNALSTLAKAQAGGLFVVFALGSLFLETFMPFNPALLLALALPVLAEKGMKSNNVGILTAYSVGAALASAYVVIAGIGRRLDLISVKGFSITGSIFILLSVILAVIYLLGSYYARQLIGIWRDAQFQRELRSAYGKRNN
eukprot:m.144129 g.144129  ORF g.144129 m.144129 type:complete len:237 (+) comp9669_c0_seq1:2565-3275(+)